MRRFSGVAAIVFSCAIGCGKTTSLSDAPRSDGNSADANLTPDARVALTVTTYSRCCTEPNHTLEPNIAVVVLKPDGSFDQMGTTDASGTVTFLGVAPGSSVTALYPVGTDYTIATVLAVKPGDSITFGDEYTLVHGAGTGTMTLDFPAVTNATTIAVYHSCGYDGATGTGLTTMTLNTTCDVTSGDLMMLAYDVNNNVIATGTLHAVAYGNGQTATLASWTPVTAQLQTMVSGLETMVTGATLHGEMIVDGVSARYGSQAYPTLSGGTGGANMPVPNGGDRLFAFSQLYATGYGEKEEFQRLASDVRTVNFGEPAMPWLGTPTYDAANQQVSWTSLGSGAYDGAYADVFWNRFDASIDTTRYYDWHVVIPPGVSMFSWTAPPTEIAPYVPATTDTIGGQLMLVDLSSSASYDELRAAPEWQLTCIGCTTLNGELPTGSSVALQAGAEGFSGFAPTTSAHRPVVRAAK